MVPEHGRQSAVGQTSRSLALHLLAALHYRKPCRNSQELSHFPTRARGCPSSALGSTRLPALCHQGHGAPPPPPPSSRLALLLFLALALAAAASNLSSHADAAGATTAAEQRGPPTDGLPAVHIIHLKGTGGDEAALAVHAHDLSLAGFCNGSGHWHAFPGYGHVIDPSMSTPLPFGNTYRDLIGGLANLPGLPLGQGPSVWATSVLASYNPATADAAAVEALKRALATMTVTTIENLRLRPAAAAVAKGWVGGDGRVAPEHLPYIEHWDIICYELVRARRTGEWGGPFTELLRERAGIRGEEDALAVVDLVVNRTFAELLKAHARSA